MITFSSWIGLSRKNKKKLLAINQTKLLLIQNLSQIRLHQFVSIEV